MWYYPVYCSGADINLIGQFGVGFYSAFLVADKVTVISKSNSDNQYIWESNADGSFTVAEDPQGNTLGRGTRIVLHLKDDSTEFLEEQKLRAVVTKYNQFGSFPIFLRVEKSVEEEVPEDVQSDVETEESAATSDEKPKKKKVTKKI